MKLKRFCVFGFDDYAAQGGFSDFMQSFDTRDEAEAFIASHQYDHKGWLSSDSHDTYQIVDLENVDLCRIRRRSDEIEGVEFA